MYYVLYLKPKKDLGAREKRKFVESILGPNESMFPRDKCPKGMLYKFAEATKTKFGNPDVTKSILWTSFLGTPFEKTIGRFYFKQDEIELARKWERFLNKVYPELETYTDGSFEKGSTHEKVLSHIYKFIEDFPVTLELSIDVKLDENQIKEVKKLVEELKTDGLFYICRQFACTSCQMRDSGTPIHFEIDYFHYSEELDTCKKCSKFESEDLVDKCELCSIDYEFFVR